MGRRFIAELIRRDVRVTALVRKGSESKLPGGCSAVVGDALDKTTFAAQIAPADTFVQLVGVTHPNPSKGKQFQSVDLGSARAGIEAARDAGIRHFIYVSVAQPAPVMKSYIEVRAMGEAMLRETGMNATILRPWYVLGPGRRWPIFLKPMYWLMEQIPSTRESARRLGLVTIGQMVGALVRAVENPPRGVRVMGVPEIRGESNS